MERKRVNKLKKKFLAGIITSLVLIVNNFMIYASIFYRITYPMNIQNFDDIIDKSELFEYEKYCKLRDYKGVVQNLSKSDRSLYIDRIFLESLKLQIDGDKKKFHFFPFHQLNFISSLDVSNESLIYLTYNNNTIIKAEYTDHTEIFTAGIGQWGNNPPFWMGNWYLNFTHIPYALNESSTIMLSNIFLVKMNLKYDWVASFWGASYLTIEQYLVFNTDFQILFVFLPLESKAVQ